MRLKEFSSKQNTDRGTSGVVSDTRSLLMRTYTRSVFRLNCSVTWLQQTFSEADKNGDGTLSIGEVHQLLHKLNVNLPKQKVRQMFQVRLEATGYHRLNMHDPLLWPTFTQSEPSNWKTASQHSLADGSTWT